MIENVIQFLIVTTFISSGQLHPAVLQFMLFNNQYIICFLVLTIPVLKAVVTHHFSVQQCIKTHAEVTYSHVTEVIWPSKSLILGKERQKTKTNLFVCFFWFHTFLRKLVTFKKTFLQKRGRLNSVFMDGQMRLGLKV